jgi:small-conductance mechanosensitive channel
MMAADSLTRLNARINAIGGDTLAWITERSHEALLAALVAGGLFLLFYGVLLLVKRWLGHPADGWQALVRAVADRTLSLFLLALAIDLASNAVAPPGVVLRVIDSLFTIAAVLQGALWLRALVLGVIHRRAAAGEDAAALGSAMGVISVLVNVVIWLLALILILDNLGVNVTALVAGLGVGGIAIGLAAQGIFSDLFAALAILFDRPFRVGDTISYGTSTGTVEHIGLKTTRIRALSGEQLVMANTKLLEQQVANLRRIEERRVLMNLGVIYQTPPDVLERLPAVLEAIVAATPDCRFDRAVFVGFGQSSLDFELVYFVTTPALEAMLAARQAVGFAIIRRFAELGVDFAYPTQTTFTAAPDGTMIDPRPVLGGDQ